MSVAPQDVSPALPPARVLAVLNPVMRVLLRTPAGRFVPGLALLEFRGRRTGRWYRVPVGLHEVDGISYVVTPARWRANFVGGEPAELRNRGRVRPVVGTLVRDPDAVAALIRRIIADGTRPAMIGIRMPAGHEVVAEDVAAIDRCAISFGADPHRA